LALVLLPYIQVKKIIGSDYVVCDSAEPKSITELQLCGVYATPVRKQRMNTYLSPKKSSVLFGIQWLQQHEIVIDNNCQNFINEISIAKWKQAPDGTVIPQPLEVNNHLLDALRYAYENDMLGGDAFVAGNEENYAAQTA
jgi:phage terminase large subunit